jgi:sugar/nucleoside kinase (ribokinase family)
MLDVVCAESPPPGSRVHSDVSVQAGGSAVNAAIAAMAAGASASVVGRIGADRHGDLVLAALADRGIEARLARDPELPTGTAVALGDPASVGVVANRGANARLSPDDVPHAVDADVLFVSGFALFQSGSAPAARAALERFTGAWAGVDLATPKLAGAAAADFDELTTGANVILATAAEARALSGAGPEEAARALASRFAVACVKLGEEGAILVHGNRTVRYAAEPVARRSPFGAGDAFAGTLLVALANGDSPTRALELACEAGARAASSVRF